MREIFQVFALIFLFTSCEVINPDEPDASFIYIEEFEIDSQPGQGTANHKISEIWAYADDQIVGVYDLPAKIPVLNKGNTNLSFFGGIKNNGLSLMRIKYPFFYGHEINLNLTPNSVDTIRPKFGYFEDLSIVQKDYDGNTPSMIPLNSNEGELSMIANTDDVFEGERCGYYRLLAGSTNLAFKEDQNLALESGNTIFLEFNYSCNNIFNIGLISRENNSDIKNLAVIINPTTEGLQNPVWNKIYIDLGLIVKERVDAQYFEIYFEAIPDQSGKEIELYLDNLKLVQF
jgi:hypothetical protein